MGGQPPKSFSQIRAMNPFAVGMSSAIRLRRCRASPSPIVPSRNSRSICGTESSSTSGGAVRVGGIVMMRSRFMTDYLPRFAATRATC